MNCRTVCPRKLHGSRLRHAALALALLGGGLAIAAAPPPSNPSSPSVQSAGAHRAGPDAEAIQRATALVNGGKCQAAHATLQAALNAHPTDARVDEALSRLAFGAGHTAQALKYAHAAERRAPRDGHYWMLLAIEQTAALQHAGFFARIWGLHHIKFDLSQAASLERRNALALLFLQQMNAHTPAVLGGDGADAHHEFSLLQRIDPGAAIASLAMDAALKKQWAQATRDLNSAIERDRSKATSVACLLVVGLIMHARHYRSARTVLRHLIIRYPGLRGAHYELAVDDLHEKAHLREARRELRQHLSAPATACTSAASRAAAHYRMGQFYELNHEPKQATTQYHVALRLDTHLVKARHALSRLTQ